MRTRIIALAELLARGCVGIGAIAVGLMMVHVCMDVGIRVLLRIPVYGTIEIVSKYMMVIIAFAPVAELQRQRQHLFVESFTALAPPRFNRILDYIVIVYFFGLAGFYIYASGKKALEKTAVHASLRTPAFDIPIWPAYWVIPVTMAVLAIVLITQILAGPAVEKAASRHGHDLEGAAK